jgi:hypothetical protein
MSIDSWEEGYRAIAEIFGFGIGPEPKGLEDLVNHIEVRMLEAENDHGSLIALREDLKRWVDNLPKE